MDKGNINCQGLLLRTHLAKRNRNYKGASGKISNRYRHDCLTKTNAPATCSSISEDFVRPVGLSSQPSLGLAKEEIRRTTANPALENLEGENEFSSEAFPLSLMTQASHELCYKAPNPPQMVSSKFLVPFWNRLPFAVASVTEQRKFKQLLDSYFYS